MIVDRPRSERAATAGGSATVPRLGPRSWRQLLETIAEIARASGLVPAIHPHAGGHVEFGDEIERVRDQTDVGFCVDSGHCAYARIDPAELIRSLGDRVDHIHLKDVDARASSGAVRTARLLGGDGSRDLLSARRWGG